MIGRLVCRLLGRHSDRVPARGLVDPGKCYRCGEGGAPPPVPVPPGATMTDYDDGPPEPYKPLHALLPEEYQ